MRSNDRDGNRVANCGWLWVLLSALLIGGGTTPPAVAAAAFGKAAFWAAGVAAAPRIPLVGDVDVDGRTDILAFYPTGDGIIDLIRTTPAGKPFFSNQARTQFGKDGVAAACGDFLASAAASGPGRARSGAQVLAMFRDGSVRLAWKYDLKSHTYQQDDVVSRIARSWIPRPPLRAVAADFEANGRPDVLLAGGDGRLLLLRNDSSTAPSFHAERVGARLEGCRQVAAGLLAAAAPAELIWLNARGELFRSPIVVGNTIHLKPRRLRLRVSRSEHLAVGRFLGGPVDDVVVGQRLLPGGDATRIQAEPALPDAHEASSDVAWLAADLSGRGRDDLLRVTRSKDRFTGDDLIAYFSGPEVQAVMARSSGDGLLDRWKTGERPASDLDLKALGCKVGRYDVIVEIQRIADVADAPLKAEMARAVQYYARLPVKDPDGSTGISLHVIYREPIPMTDAGKPWWEMGDRYFPASHRGVCHWMVVYHGGGGQSDQMADRGSCGNNAYYSVFLHEFGHQLGLDHTGYWGPSWCPTYPSLMNYAYNYQLDGSAANVGYSDGRLKSAVLDERHLNEYLPLPEDQIKFLAGPPYHYRLKLAPDGKGTLIDWNWNGIFGEKNVAADINYGYSTTAGERDTIGKSYTAPTPAVIGSGKRGRLVIFFGRLPEGAARPPADATAAKPGLSPDQPGRLLLRLWTGGKRDSQGDRWSDEIAVEPSGVTGDPSAVGGPAAWVAYPTERGALLRQITLNLKGVTAIGPPTLAPGTAGAQVTLAKLAGRLVLLLWRDAWTPVGIRWVDVRKGAVVFGPETSLGFTSTVPPGAAAGARDSGGTVLWVGGMQDQSADRTGRWQVRRFVFEPRPRHRSEGIFVEQDPGSASSAGTTGFVRPEWIGGEKGAERGSSRVTLLWAPDRALGRDGQLYFFACGLFGKQSPWSCHYVATRIADQTVNGGWLTRRYYDEWTQSRSAPGICYFRGDILFAARWFGDVHGWDNDNLFVAFHGTGIESDPMGDFDDIGLIQRVGLTHSIAYMQD